MGGASAILNFGSNAGYVGYDFEQHAVNVRSVRLKQYEQLVQHTRQAAGLLQLDLPSFGCAWAWLLPTGGYSTFISRLTSPSSSSSSSSLQVSEPVLRSNAGASVLRRQAQLEDQVALGVRGGVPEQCHRRGSAGPLVVDSLAEGPGQRGTAGSTAAAAR
jgi:hypothetical protein